MRPLRLALKGFTAFRDQAELDFTGLEVFAISGPTGSGKSSLLDAMTYALYGRVERVGDRVSQLISQGQPRMAVTLEFQVGRDRYRVTRTTPARGATRILLERMGPEGWRQAGEGADRVRDAERLIAGAIGLSYDGFTRSVLLPQGRFAELLVGEPRRRRDILSELLGLSLFRRMAERAGAVAREASVRARTIQDLLRGDYADATRGALREARAAAREAAARRDALARAEREVAAVRSRWEEVRRQEEDLRSCLDEAAEAAEGARAAARELRRLGGELSQAEEEVARAREREARARARVEEAEATLALAVERLGSAEDLDEAWRAADRLARARREREGRAGEGARIAREAGALAGRLEVAERALTGRREEVEARLAEVRRAEQALEEARHADLVAAVAGGLRAGDPCPVCGAPLREVPRGPGAQALDRAAEALDRARAALVGAEEGLRDAERARDALHRDLQATSREERKVAAELARVEEAIVAEERSLAGVLGSPLPPDPEAALRERRAELARLGEARDGALREMAEAPGAVLAAERDLARLEGEVSRVRDRLAAGHRGLFERADRAAGRPLSPPDLPPVPEAGTPSELEGYAAALAEALDDLGRRLAGEEEGRRSTEGRLLEEATALAAGLVEPAGTLEELAAALAAARTSATEEAAAAEHRAEDLGKRVERRRELEREAKDLEARARVFGQLALELRADRLIAFLQSEALQLLAAAGSERLAELSEGRYRLSCREEEFVVVDTWNGDEERSVRTLSGGETFVASLALALALAEQVRSLSVADRARLDSLFLDEGFGTLDPESLRVVVDAIERLGGDGRLVGVITHVRDLAEQFPRVEVRKSPRGSCLETVP